MQTQQLFWQLLVTLLFLNTLVFIRQDEIHIIVYSDSTREQLRLISGKNQHINMVYAYLGASQNYNNLPVVVFRSEALWLWSVRQGV